MKNYTPAAAMAPHGRATSDDVGDRWLGRAAVFFTIAIIIHNGDHVRRGGETLSLDVFWVGGLGGVALEVGLVVVISQRHRVAPIAAAVVGAGLAAAYLKVHFLPAHSWLSDSFTSGSTISPLSWVAASLEVAAAMVLAVVGVVVLRRRGGLASAAGRYEAERRLVEAVVQPVALIVIVSQAFMLAAFFVQRYG